MSQPRDYTRQYNFKDFQATSPSSPLPGTEVDAELNSVKLTLDDLNANIAKVQRDDGKLGNTTVHKDAFDQGALAIINSTFTPRGVWATAIVYSVNDAVNFNGATYVATAAHTSSAAFATDSAASRWILIANAAIAGTGSAVDKFEGNGSTTAFTLSYSYESETSFLVFVNGELLNPVDDYTLSGTTLTLYTAPGSPSVAGNENLIVWGASVVGQAAKEAAESAESNASGFADESESWATKTSGIVESTDYSSKAWATGGTGVDAGSGSAKDWASKTGGTVGNTSEYSAKKHAADGLASAGASETSKLASVAAQAAAETAETNSETAETNSAASASASQASRLASVAAQGLAETAQTNAETAAALATTNGAAQVVLATDQVALATTQAGLATTNGAAQVTLATTQAGLATTNGAAQVALATTQASNAAGSASTASTQAGISTTKASEASASASAAAASAASITDEETNAAASAAASAGSATASANSAASAAAALDNFDDRYLGPKSSEPTTDNDGNALISGSLYFSTAQNAMQVFDGANWIAASAAGVASMILYEYTATSGQTTFTGADDNSNSISFIAGNEIVVLNGVILDPSDYNSSSGTSIVLASGAATGDLLNVYAFKSFTVADTVSASAGGTFAGNVTVTGSFTSQGIDDNANATAITIDSSENVLVGKTSNSFGTTGVALNPDGSNNMTRSGDPALALNRLSSDGAILGLYKDGATVGSIGSDGNDFFITGSVSNIAGIMFANSKAMPMKSGSSTNAAVDLGSSSYRWKDAYLSGGVYLGGTGSANKLDDYEEGEFDVSLTPNAGGSITMQNNRTKAKYTKIGNLVTVSGQIRTDSVSNMSGDHIYMSLPYAIASGSDLSSHGWSHVVIYGSSYTNRDMGLWTFDGSSTARFLDSTYVNIPQNAFNGGEEIIFTLSYKTA